MTPRTHLRPTDEEVYPATALTAAAARHFPAVSLRVRASLTRRRLAVENAQAAGANRRITDDVRDAA
jgi:hypothetical protein